MIHVFSGGAARGVVDALQEHVFNEDLMHYGERRQKADCADEIMGSVHIWYPLVISYSYGKAAFLMGRLIINGHVQSLC